MLAPLIPFLCLVAIWALQPVYAFLVIKNGSGPLVGPGYNGNDPKHFPKWEPYVTATT